MKRPKVATNFRKRLTEMTTKRLSENKKTFAIDFTKEKDESTIKKIRFTKDN